MEMVRSANPPLRFALSKYAYSKFRKKIASLSQELDDWEKLGFKIRRNAQAYD
jgi:hypothetical protein